MSQSNAVKKHSTMNDIKRKRTVFIIGMLSVGVVQFLIFWVYVNFNSILMAFEIRTSSGVKFGFDNFVRFFQELKLPTYQLDSTVLNSLKLFFTNAVIILPLSLVLSYFMFKKILLSKVFRVVFFLPSIISSVVLVTIFKNIVATQGPLNSFLSLIAGKAVQTEWLTDDKLAMGTILFYCVWTGFGSNIVLLSGAIHRIPQDVLEYGQIDGVGNVRELFCLVIPMIWPTLSTLTVFATAGIFTNMGPILLFTQGQYDTMTIGYFIFDRVKGNQYEYPAAIGLIFTIISIPVVFLVKWGMGKAFEDVEY